MATGTATSSMVVLPSFWQVAALGPEAYCLNWSKLRVVPGSVGEEHIDDLSQFVTNTSRIQLFQDAALIGKAVKEGTAKLGLTLSGKSTLLANDKSVGKLIFGHLEDEGVPICLGTWDRNRGGKKMLCSQPMETNMERQTQGQEHNWE